MISKTKIENKNLLGLEKSPYLLQHANNPVHWRAWNDESFQKARDEDKPIFLSIGYSTCHWCHVMEHESFENEYIANILNENFISIKVDREERPDIDSVYMSVAQAMTGSGGWPLTIIMTPDQKPFFAATYIPPDDATGARFGRRGLDSILNSVVVAWQTRRDEILLSGDRIIEHINKTEQPISSDSPSPELINSAANIMSSTYDEKHGGFGSTGPKFPTPHMLSLLLRHWKRTGDKISLGMVEGTLSNIIDGGIHDHLGGGFARYSTDREWLVPHFEKMLYDQALLTIALLETFQATRKIKYAEAASLTLDYVLRDMTSEEGGFYSAEDADSEGEEGKFYVWTPAEIEEILGEEDAQIFNAFYEVTDRGNFEHGTSILHVTFSKTDFADRNNIDEAQFDEVIARGQKKLFEARNKRVRPHLDDKVLTSWNGLMISAMARASRILDDGHYLSAARNSAKFILENLYRDERLHRRYRDGETAVKGFLDDYAFFTLGLIDLYEATLEFEYLDMARKLTESMLVLFWDDEHGAFFEYADDAEELITRSKAIYDGAEPSGNSVAMLVLLKMSHYTDVKDFDLKFERAFGLFTGQIKQYPPGFAQALIALDYYLGPPVEIVISGELEDTDAATMLDAAYANFVPVRAIAFKSESNRNKIEKLIPFTDGKDPIDGKSTGYVCKNRACKYPVHDAQAFVDQLHGM